MVYSQQWYAVTKWYTISDGIQLAIVQIMITAKAFSLLLAIDQIQYIHERRVFQLSEQHHRYIRGAKMRQGSMDIK